MSLLITKLIKIYPPHTHDTRVFDGLTLEIVDRSFVSFVGPNGCGKTTLLNILSGLDTDYSGTVTISENECAYIFQNYRDALFPWLTVGDNIAYPLKLRGVPFDERKAVVDELSQRFGVSFKASSYPYSLSGGQQQLVSILRGLVIGPHVILMDEPFASVDFQNTIFLMTKLQEIWQSTGATIVLVTHNIDEAILLSQRIIVLNGSPSRIVSTVENNAPYPRTVDFVGTSQFKIMKHNLLQSLSYAQ